MRSDRWGKRHKDIMAKTYGCGERYEVGRRERGWRERDREMGGGWWLKGCEGGVWGKAGTVRWFPNSSLKFIVWKTCGLNLFWGKRRTRSHSSALHTGRTHTHTRACTHTVHLKQPMKSCPSSSGNRQNAAENLNQRCEWRAIFYSLWVCVWMWYVFHTQFFFYWKVDKHFQYSLCRCVVFLSTDPTLVI